MIMDYRTTIPEKRIHEISAETIRRYMPDAGDQDCVELTETFLILGKYMDNFFTDERYVTINCSDMEFRYLGNVATSYKDTLDTWSELISLGTPAIVRYNVKPTRTFSEICNDIAVRLGAVMAEISREPIHTLGIDIETYSSEDIANGVYRYADAEDFTILLFAYSVNDGPVLITDIAQGEEIPPRIVEALTDPHVLKTAFNAAFERTCLNKFLGLHMDAEQWECTMVRSAMLGLPLSLDAVGRVLKLEQQKMQEGKALIRYFSCPCKPTKVNGGRTRNLPQHAPEKWATFKRYCVRDVEVEQAIRRITAAYRIPESEHRLYVADQRINDRGVLVDMDLVTQAIRMDAAYKGRLNAEAMEISGLDNPNSVAQLKAWLEKETDTTVEKLSKKDLPALLAFADNDKVERMLRIRQEMAKTSTKKYEAMRKTACSDGRVRGLLQFYGANRTGRWAGRLVQVQNLPQNHLEDLDYARSLVKSGDLSAVELLFGNVPDTLSQLIRTAFIAKDGCTFLVCDFSAIEARVIAWLAGEQWRLEVFRTHGKIYEASASMMFHVPVDEITKTDPRRQKGKIAELALGYQGGVGAMKTMGGESMGLTEEEMSEIVDNWRNANPAIVRLWKDVEAAARMVIRYGEPVSVKGLKFFMSLGAMMIQLPSGRCLSYPRPSVGVNRFGSESICYEGVSQTSKQWCQQETYGGKLVENIVQGIARDCLAITILRLEEKGYPIVFHVHDEVIIEAPENDGVHTLQGVEEIFRMPITWAPGLPLKGAGYTTKYYLKD